MRNDNTPDFGAGGGVDEVDETFIGDDRAIKPKHTTKVRSCAHKHKIFPLVDHTTTKEKILSLTM